jgi:hypothetical protein
MSRALGLVVDLLRGGRAVRMVARGGSMWPTIRDGEVVQIEPRQPRSGEVAAALHQGQLTIHRVIRIDENSAVLRGDALDRTERVSLVDLLGTVPARRASPVAKLAARVRRRLRNYFSTQM